MRIHRKVQLFQVVIIKYKKKLNQGLVYATLCGGPHLQVLLDSFPLISYLFQKETEILLS
jgi:hypothetical protein